MMTELKRQKLKVKDITDIVRRQPVLLKRIILQRLNMKFPFWGRI
jgi:hypothetical protein